MEGLERWSSDEEITPFARCYFALVYFELVVFFYFAFSTTSVRSGTGLLKSL